MSDNDDKRQFDKVFASEFTPDDNEYLPTGEVCHLNKKDFDERSRLKIRDQVTTVQGTEYDFSQGRDSTIDNLILVRALNYFNNLTIATMSFVVRYSDNFKNLYCQIESSKMR